MKYNVIFAGNSWSYVFWENVSYNALIYHLTITLFSRTELIRRIKRYQIANHACLMIKYSKDDRYDKNGVATHDK